MSIKSRSDLRGGALAAAMLFFVVVTVAGASLLSVSMITQQSIIRSGYDVKLLIAAEAGLETVKGRFTLTQGVLDDWSQILPNPNVWNNIGGPMPINGIPVQAQGMSVGTPAVPRAKIRAIATQWNRSRVVEYEIRVPSFSDYTLYDASNNGLDVPQDSKVYGNIYSLNSIGLSNRSGIEFFGEVSTSGVIQGIADATYTFKEGYEERVPVISLPPLNGMDQLRAAAANAGTLFYANTVSIQFLEGNRFRRTFMRREATSGGNQYVERAETLNIPQGPGDEGVAIYVSKQTAPFPIDTIVGLANNNSNLSSTNAELRFHGGVLGMPGQPQQGARVTLAFEGVIALKNAVAYQTLLENPALRKIENKQTDAAVGFREMLGVVAQGRFIADNPGNWTPLQTSPENHSVGGHLPLQFPLDGVFMSAERLTSLGSSSNVPQRELWLNGGLIAGGGNVDMLKSHFGILNYHTDWRLQYTMPPYFLRAYGDNVVMVRGSWRTYELP